MKDLPKRKISEQIQIYKHEPSLRDIFVEGPTDKSFYEYFLTKMGASNFRAYSIEFLDFVGEIELEEVSNKNKLIQFSQKLQNTFGTKLTHITCIADRDHNDFSKEASENYYLFFTDFTCLEMYWFNEIDLDKFLRLSIQNFPIAAKDLIKALGEVLQSIFIINCSKLSEYKNAIPPKFDSIMKINKNGSISYDAEEYLMKFLQKNNLLKYREQFELKIKTFTAQLTKDYRNQIRGKDAVTLLSKFLQVIKNSSQYTEESLGRTLLLLPDETVLKTYNLFQKLMTRYA